ncbi:uncharacterized protein [Rutidosis leptorrhynchoides]|uniref:uncharacterized protein n=1 Tax=Rutidosis leptorrhynchoides TaxID=125765 RepID=UPI003A98DF6D
MLLNPITPTIPFPPSLNHRHHRLLITNTLNKHTKQTLHRILIATAAASAVVLLSPNMSAVATSPKNPPQDAAETLENVPQTLSGDCVMGQDGDCKKPRIQKPKSRKAEYCTIKCVTTCIRGGDGSPGEGPINVKKPLFVFKQGFRSRHYCLVECSDVCNLIRDGYDEP